MATSEMSAGIDSQGHAAASAFSPAQCASLDGVLDLIVPPSADGRMPGAVEVGVPAYLQTHCAEMLPVLCEELDRLDALAQSNAGQPFAALAATERQALVEALRSQDPDFMRRLALETVSCYYQHDRVLAALGMALRSPAPQGFKVIAGDLMLLSPVRQRGRIWRET